MTLHFLSLRSNGHGRQSGNAHVHKPAPLPLDAY